MKAGRSSKLVAVSAIAALGLATAGCSGGTGSREGAGTAIGAAAGAVIGSQFGGGVAANIVGGVVGAAIGGFIGNRIGAALDEEERRQLAALTRQTAATGSMREYRSPRTRTRVVTRVVNRTPATATSRECRTIQQEVIKADGTRVTDNVQVCRGPNGWVA